MQKAEWVDLAQRKVIAMRERHSTDRIKLELLLETTPRDSRYSSALIELMRKEEISGKDHLSPTAQIISSKVDEALQFETKAFFAKISSHNIRKWNVFKEKMTMERDALKAELTGSSEAVTSENDSCEFPCIDELALEEMRLDEDYNRNWLKYENFNLQEAFKSQAAKVESDWQVHESSLVDDYRKRKDRIMGTIRKSSTASNVSGEVQDQRWQHPEKQKTLIHTAPVLSPSRQEIKSGKGKKDANTLMELDRLDREYNNAKGMLEKQKAEAKRWLFRQKIRLIAQAEEVAKEKAFVGSHLEKELSDFMEMCQIISNR